MKVSVWVFAGTMIATTGSAFSADPPIKPATCDAAFPGKISVLPINSFALLQNGYTVRGPTGDYSRDYRGPLHRSPSGSDETAYRDLIVTAYRTSTAFLKRRLCLLDHIFIDLGSAANNPVKGWGFWERPTQSGPYEPQVDPVTAFTKRKFVGLTADFLSKVQRLNDYEKAIADSQVPNNGLSYSSTLNGTTTPIEVTVRQLWPMKSDTSFGLASTT